MVYLRNKVNMYMMSLFISLKFQIRRSLGGLVSVVQLVTEIQKVISMDNWIYWLSLLENLKNKSSYKNQLNNPFYSKAGGLHEIISLMFKGRSIFNTKVSICGDKYGKNYD